MSSAGLNVHDGVTLNRTKMILTTRAKVVSSIFIIGFTTYLLYVSYQAEFRQGMSQLINVNCRTGKSTN